MSDNRNSGTCHNRPICFRKKGCWNTEKQAPVHLQGIPTLLPPPLPDDNPDKWELQFNSWMGWSWVCKDSQYQQRMKKRSKYGLLCCTAGPEEPQWEQPFQSAVQADDSYCICPPVNLDQEPVKTLTSIPERNEKVITCETQTRPPVCNQCQNTESDPKVIACNQSTSIVSYRPAKSCEVQTTTYEEICTCQYPRCNTCPRHVTNTISLNNCKSVQNTQKETCPTQTSCACSMPKVCQSKFTCTYEPETKNTCPRQVTDTTSLNNCKSVQNTQKETCPTQTSCVSSMLKVCQSKSTCTYEPKTKNTSMITDDPCCKCYSYKCNCPEIKLPCCQCMLLQMQQIMCLNQLAKPKDQLLKDTQTEIKTAEKQTKTYGVELPQKVPSEPPKKEKTESMKKKQAVDENKAHTSSEMSKKQGNTSGTTKRMCGCDRYKTNQEATVQRQMLPPRGVETTKCVCHQNGPCICRPKMPNRRTETIINSCLMDVPTPFINYDFNYMPMDLMKHNINVPGFFDKDLLMVSEKRDLRTMNFLSSTQKFDCLKHTTYQHGHRNSKLLTLCDRLLSNSGENDFFANSSTGWYSSHDIFDQNQHNQTVGVQTRKKRNQNIGVQIYQDRVGKMVQTMSRPPVYVPGRGTMARPPVYVAGKGCRSSVLSKRSFLMKAPERTKTGIYCSNAMSRSRKSSINRPNASKVCHKVDLSDPSENDTENVEELVESVDFTGDLNGNDDCLACALSKIAKDDQLLPHYKKRKNKLQMLDDTTPPSFRDM